MSFFGGDMKTKLPIILLMPLATISSLSGCGGKQTTPTDASKTQIYVNNFRRGFGSEWLDSLCRRFEEANKDISYEEGKTGVQIIVSNIGSPADSRMGSILGNRDEVYFTEQSYYFDFQTYNGVNLLEDITDVVTEPLTEYNETRSIEDKLTDEQKDFYGVKGGATPRYYALAHYNGFFGFNYDVDLFDKYGFYFAETPLSGTNGQFITTRNAVKSSGPNGILGDWDDGLPKTYDQFYQLCDYMVFKGCIPWVASSKEAFGYMNLLVNSMATDHEGMEQMFNKFKNSGTMTDLGEVDDSGNITKLPATELTKENGYMAYKMLGQYHALKFLKTLHDNPNYHHPNLTATSGYSAEASQNDFLRSRIFNEKNPSSGTKPIGMISEGIWWEAETSENSSILADQYGEEYRRENRRFAFLPFPKATEERYAQSHKNTLFDHLFSLVFMKSGIAEWKKPLIKKFLRFAHTDESLRDFTVKTNTTKAFNYELTAEDEAKMTYYGKTLVQLKKESDVLYPGNSSSIYINNASKFHYNEFFFTEPSKGKTVQYAWDGIHDQNLSAEKYFTGIGTYRQNNWADFH